jgi:glyoxylase-like metal-dependent hydrolase (beta-lactamase superfamily II)
MPAEAEHVRSALADRDVFIYCGHGGGDPWLGTGATPTARR